MGGFDLILKAGLISLLWLPTTHVSAETVTVHQTLNTHESCSFPNPLNVKVIRIKEDDFILSLTTNRIIHVPQLVVLIKTDEATKKTIYQPVEIPQSNVAYHNYDHAACFVAHCIKHKNSNVAFYIINGTLHINGTMFQLHPERKEPRFGSHDVIQDYVMEPVDASGGSRVYDYIEVPDNDALKFSLENQVQSNTHTNRNATEYFIDVLPVVDYYLYTRWLSRSNNDQTQALAAIVSYLTNVFTGVALRYTTLRLPNQKQLTVQMVTPYISLDVSTSWFTEDHMIDLGDGRHFVQIYDQLDSFSEWIKENGEIPHNDHAMLFTGYEWYGESRYSTKRVLGTTWADKICTKDQGRSSSIIMDRMGYQSELTAAHELGHSLSARHDGYNNVCSPSAQHIMTPSAPLRLNDNNMHNSFKFSPCTSDEISAHISSLEPTAYLEECLLASSGTEMPDTPPTPHPIDQLCPSLYGNGSSLCWGGSEHPLTALYLCTSLFCEDDEGECHHVIPPSGTCCGNGKFCVQGMCSPAPAGECVIGDVDLPPSNPVLTVDDETVTMLEIVHGRSAMVQCFVDGGNPEIISLSLTCGGRLIHSDSGDQLNAPLRAETSLHQQECVCTAVHVTRLYDKTASFTVFVTYLVPEDPPIIIVDGERLIFHNQIARHDINKTIEINCYVDGGIPEVHQVYISCGGKDVGVSYGFGSNAVFNVTSEFDQARCVCSADHITGQYNLTTSMVIDIKSVTPRIVPYMREILGDGVGLHSVSAVAGVVIVTQVIVMAVYIKMYRRATAETSYIHEW